MKDISNNEHPLDDFGKLTDPWPNDYPLYDFRKLLEYCKKENKKTSDLSDEELKLFEILE